MNPTKANTARLHTWIAQLASETDQARHSAQFQAYLAAMLRFWRYSAANILLILMQAPDATLVNSKRRWAALGYRLKNPARALEILCPQFRLEPDPNHPDDRDKRRPVLTHFATGYIYDVSQVEPTADAQPLELAWSSFAGESYDALYLLVLAACHHLKIGVDERETLPRGVLGFSTGQGQIVILASLESGSKVAVLLHELAHEVAHPTALRERRGITRAMAECQAEAICYALYQALEVPELAGNSGQYLALYGVTTEVLKANLEDIARYTTRLLTVIEETAEAIKALPDDSVATSEVA